MVLFDRYPRHLITEALGFFVQVFGWFYWIQTGTPVIQRLLPRRALCRTP
jgi:hypothetical protein